MAAYGKRKEGEDDYWNPSLLLGMFTGWFLSIFFVLPPLLPRACRQTGSLTVGIVQPCTNISSLVITTCVCRVGRVSQGVGNEKG